jgi:hypothetical protein
LNDHSQPSDHEVLHTRLRAAFWYVLLEELAELRWFLRSSSPEAQYTVRLGYQQVDSSV